MEADEQQNELPQATAMNVGRHLVGWEVDEYPRHVRSRLWYVLAGIVGAALIVYAVATANFLFAVILLMAGIISLISSFQEPRRIGIMVTTTGLIVGDTYHDYKSVKDFSIVYNPPETKMLYLTFRPSWRPLLAIPLEDADPNAVREHLLPFCLENLDRTEERLTDMLRRLYKL